MRINATTQVSAIPAPFLSFGSRFQQMLPILFQEFVLHTVLIEVFHDLDPNPVHYTNHVLGDVKETIPHDIENLMIVGITVDKAHGTIGCSKGLELSKPKKVGR